MTSTTVIATNCKPSEERGAWTCRLCGFRGFWTGAAHCTNTDPEDSLYQASKALRESRLIELEKSHAELVHALDWALHRIRISLDCGELYDHAARVLEQAEIIRKLP